MSDTPEERATEPNTSADPMDVMPSRDCTFRDPRFQNANATRYCYTHYVDYHRCQHVLGKDEPDCEIFKKTYQRMCPNSWIDRWDGQRKKGNFARNCKTELD
ncbi:Cytochrome c oxidase, subunit VIb [Cinara cedri]|uniref:Cytochrome c oxidase, subunit VIb n=1 Tax=Cinara cedri TaxID=506608 RepID=A0A5E4MMX4_9HEMI|nr:Cytochrome c oxidase, subunit VIb [Cinara cedri]